MAQPFDAGSMFVGCNYWASHAGTNMWKDWNEEIVRSDLARLRKSGIAILRVFPLWPDFQPLRLHYVGAGMAREVRMGEDPLPPTEAGRAGVSEVMLERFRRFMDIAREQDIRLIVGLLTGWMSGRLHVPEMLEGRNVLTDPIALRWEIRFVHCMVRQFKDHPALLAWDLGNECNCMGRVDSADQFYLWTAAIANTIRAEDNVHPLVSGMHGMRPQTNELPEDQGELNDIVCTHPYPKFTPYCDTDPIVGMKSALHAAAESRMYAGLAGKPCFVEEAGTLGPMFASPDNAADYLRGMLLSVWRYDCRGLMWWCAFDQSHLAHTPYDWNAVERELGLLTLDGEKPVAHVMAAFNAFIRRAPIDHLPPCAPDAMCVLTRDQDTWAAAYGSFILACQAKLELRYVWCEDEIPESGAYLLPSLRGDRAISGRQLALLLRRVREGATLYMSLDDALLSPFESFTGLRVEYRQRQTDDAAVEAAGERFTLPREYRLAMKSVGAQIFGTDEAGAPFMSRFQYGEGVVWVINAPIERAAATLPGITDGSKRQPLYRLYRLMNLRRNDRVFDCDDPLIGCTEYPDTNGSWLFVQNYSQSDREIVIAAAQSCRIDCLDSPSNAARLTAQGNGTISLFIPHHDGCLARVEFI